MAPTYSRSLIVDVQTEQLPLQHRRGYSMTQQSLADYLAWSQFCDLVVEWRREGAGLLNGVGPTVLHLPHGPLLGAAYVNGAATPADETHEILLLGGLGGPEKRRRRIFLQLSKDSAVHPAAGPLMWGDAIVQAPSTSLLTLNMKSDQSVAFPSPQFLRCFRWGGLCCPKWLQNHGPLSPILNSLRPRRQDS